MKITKSLLLFALAAFSFVPANAAAIDNTSNETESFARPLVVKACVMPLYSKISARSENTAAKADQIVISSASCVVTVNTMSKAHF